MDYGIIESQNALDWKGSLRVIWCNYPAGIMLLRAISSLTLTVRLPPSPGAMCSSDHVRPKCKKIERIKLFLLAKMSFESSFVIFSVLRGGLEDEALLAMVEGATTICENHIITMQGLSSHRSLSND